MATFVRFVPIIERVKVAIMGVRSQRVVHADKRTKLVPGMLWGMIAT